VFLKKRVFYTCIKENSIKVKGKEKEKEIIEMDTARLFSETIVTEASLVLTKFLTCANKIFFLNLSPSVSDMITILRGFNCAVLVPLETSSGYANKFLV
jgi:hypothetical protein